MRCTPGPRAGRRQAMACHRGRKHDPLYGILCPLRVGYERLADRGFERIWAGLDAGDPFGEVGAAWGAKELVREIYSATDRFEARRRLEAFFDWAAEVDVPEVTRLATTVDRWRHEPGVLHHQRRVVGSGRGRHLGIEEIDRTAKGFRNPRNYRMRILLKLRVSWQTAPTPRLRGTRAQSLPLTPASTA